MNFKLVSNGWKEFTVEKPILYENCLLIYRNSDILDWCIAQYDGNAFFDGLKFKVMANKVVAWAYLEEIGVVHE